MAIGAVVVAAGLSSRMGDFKPMMGMGSISVAQRVVATLKQAGVEKIVFVTGYRADDLEHHLARDGILFLRNPDYGTTEMFESARIGLGYLQGKCDRVLFTPVDIPLFTSDTVAALLASEGEMCVPACGGKTGHPILLSARAIGLVLQDSGEGGLRGAISRSGIRETRVPIEDPGILMDMDTQEDYTALLEYHNRQLVRPSVQVALVREKVFFDARTSLLLSLIDELGSVRRACQRMQLSYSSGWHLIKLVEEQSGVPLVARSQGGARGSSSSLTPEGRLLLRDFERYAASVRQAAQELYRSMFPDGMLAAKAGTAGEGQAAPCTRER